MKNFISKLKINTAYYLFQRPFSLPLTPGLKKKVHQAQDLFNSMLYKEYDLEASLDFKAYEFHRNGAKTALVVHGWMSKSLYMVKIIETLVKCDYRVIAIDLPGHGGAKAQKISWKDSVNAILKSQEYFNGFDLALGHSYGGTMILSSTGVTKEVNEIQGFLDVKNIIMVASPVKIMTAINLFSSNVRLSKEEKEKLTNKTEADSGAAVDRLDGVYLQKKYPTKTTIHCVHDTNDRIVPFEDSQYLQELGDRTSLKKVDSLGHIKIIYDKFVMSHLEDYLKSIKK